MMRPACTNDPVEIEVFIALKAIGVDFVHESQDNKLTKCLDFYIPSINLYIEVARGHTPRKIEQLSRVDNVIYIQGLEAAKCFGNFISGLSSMDRASVFYTPDTGSTPVDHATEA